MGQINIMGTHNDIYVLFNNAGDLIAVMLLILFVAEVSRQKHRGASLSHFLMGLLMLMGGISFQLFGGYYGESVINAGLSHNYLSEAQVHSILGAFLIAVSITKFFSEITDVEDNREHRTIRRCFFTFILVLLAAASWLFWRSNSYWPFNLVFILQLVGMTYYNLHKGYVRFSRKTLLIAVFMSALCFFLGVIWPLIKMSGIALTFMYIIMYIDYANSLEKTLISRELELSKSRVQLLTEQISPHFIFNSLQTIEGICDTEPENVKPALDVFSSYLRGNLESLTMDEMIPFSKELEHTEAYIKLEKMGGGKDFEVEYRLAAENFMLPPLVLQPLVENAVRYGVGASSEGGKVIIETTDMPDRIVIRVINEAHGDSGLTAQQKRRKSIGLNNVRERIETQCNGTLKLETADDMTTATIELPKSF